MAQTDKLAAAIVPSTAEAKESTRLACMSAPTISETAAWSVDGRLEARFSERMDRARVRANLAVLAAVG
jgi:hypothetical protein